MYAWQTKSFRARGLRLKPRACFARCRVGNFTTSLYSKYSKKAKRALTHLLPTIISLDMHDLLNLLLATLLEHDIPVNGMAVKAAAALPQDQAIECLEVLFALGWDVNEPLSNTEPPVLSVALHDTSLAHWLLQNGADPNAECDIDYTPLYVAVNRSTMPTVQLLLQYAQHSHNGHLVYHATQRADNLEATKMIKLLHDHHKPIDDIFSIPTGTPLFYACSEDKRPIALTLIELGADPDKPCLRYNEIVGPSPRQVALDHGWDLSS
ncbi:hypothetical protein CERZMDRAFT_112062 [Cercospora zeae-maydis SCOH1-5]|uniref:Uncharacterized protein n=1 Tax=Cercospora zeae-maydis SCOH1-5 TaxID=717836 RepID=A0A6A6FGA5_9PEZI|nr:hypothetical protein CERZMDRAFT_112062 [Cercospora zeae-maydis SCOH1-5]